MTSSPHFTNICTLPLPTDLFAQSLHPTRPLLAVALASGHVQTYQLPSTDEPEEPPPSIQPLSSLSSFPPSNGTHNGILSLRRRSSTASENGLGNVETLWKTRRHKGSARTISYSPDGSTCFSGGTDGIVKMFDIETGRVVGKIGIPGGEAPTVVRGVTPLHLIVATDEGGLLVYDVRGGNAGAAATISSRPGATFHPHGNEHVSALVPLPASESSTSGWPKQFVTVGASTLSVTDLRKGVVATSEDQECELTSVAVVTGFKKGGTSVGEKVIVGQSDGVISLWERGAWGDLDERIVVDRFEGGASVDCLCEIPGSFLPTTGGRKGSNRLKMGEKIVAAGLDDGRVRFVRLGGRNGVVSEWDLKHDDVEGCVDVSFDTVGERMVTGGGLAVKVWTRASAAEEGMDTGLSNGMVAGGKRKSRGENDSDGEEEEGDGVDSDEEEQDQDQDQGQDSGDDDDSSEEDRTRAKRKKRKRNKGKDKTGGRALHLSGSF